MKKIIIGFFIIIYTFLAPSFVYAFDCSTCLYPGANQCSVDCKNCGLCSEPTGICNPIIKGLCGENNAPAKFGGLISSIFVAFLVVGALFTLFNLFTGGLMWITSGGDKAGLENARNRILNAVIGLGVLAASWAIFIIISQFLGLGSGFGFSLPTLFSQ